MSEDSPLVKLLVLFQRIVEGAEALLSEHGEDVLRFAKLFMAIDALDEAGWLPHVLVDVTDIDLQSRDTIRKLAEDRYRAASPVIEHQLLEDIASGGWSELVVGPLQEAVSAHRSGHYRATTRLVFPALEALVRTALGNRRWGNETRLMQLRDAVLNDAMDVSFPPPVLVHLKLWEKLHAHCLEKVNTADAFERFSASQIPNRHACMHGLIDYRTFQHSLNSLILAAYVLKVTQLVRSQAN